jgi:hypothetical protein
MVLSAFHALLAQFIPLFTQPSFANFVALHTGWILCVGRHTISRTIRAMGASARRKHHSVFYRFFSRAVWETDAVGKILFRLFLPFVPGLRVQAILDDTLCRKSGPHVWGAAMHYDPLASTYGGGAGRRLAWAFGHNWVVLALWVPFPWNPDRGAAIPVLVRLYRSKKRCPSEVYRKRTELAVELVHRLAEWLPADSTLVLTTDAEYACQTLVQSLPLGVEFVGPARMDAALHDRLPACGTPRWGRPRKKGHRLPSPRQFASDRRVPWRKTTLNIYGRKVEALIKTRVVLWYRVSGPRPVRLVVTRDPKGRIEDRAYFSTGADWPTETILAFFARRWALEVTFFNAKQFLGLEDPQNGWGRRSGKRRGRKRPGPQPRGHKGERAVGRTVPFIFIAHGLIHLWYFQHGSARQDVQAARFLAPWYGHKKEPSFADMLGALRKDLCRASLSAHPELKCLQQNIMNALPGCLWAA